MAYEFHNWTHSLFSMFISNSVRAIYPCLVPAVFFRHPGTQVRRKPGTWTVLSCLRFTVLFFWVCTIGTHTVYWLYKCAACKCIFLYLSRSQIWASVPVLIHALTGSFNSSASPGDRSWDTFFSWPLDTHLSVDCGLLLSDWLPVSCGYKSSCDEFHFKKVSQC